MVVAKLREIAPGCDVYADAPQGRGLGARDDQASAKDGDPHEWIVSNAHRSDGARQCRRVRPDGDGNAAASCCATWCGCREPRQPYGERTSHRLECYRPSLGIYVVVTLRAKAVSTVFR